ncbi:hypothetical protein HPB51_016427 [Rhipicephalus microplus]|uniref:Secreted protein n=1 Tax=Rhipicephalus microplus TaxID=6941 RepID=A0A9J6DB58_RHIMP|nr:uncharacterized protein LOC119175525 [Rhipicephalus microplus]KAH8019062.1 hypothetical protein HPB51_016427 [Rhipicephalus microplus]
MLCFVVLCLAVQLSYCGDVEPGGLGPGSFGGPGSLSLGDGFGVGLLDPLSLGSPGAAQVVPLATTVSFVRQPFIRIGYVARPVVTYVHQPVASVSHTIRPVVHLKQELVGFNVPLAGGGLSPGGPKGLHYGWKK